MPKNIFGLLLIVCCLYACQEEGRNKVLIDNPTTKKITLTIDEQVITLDSSASRFLWLNTGEHTMKFRDSSFSFSLPSYPYNEKIRLVINPVRYGYILEQITYSDKVITSPEDIKRLEENRKNDYNNRIPYGSIRVMDVFSISGNYKKTYNQFIADDWDYGIYDAVPGQTTIRGYALEKQVVKLHREMDFLLGLGKKHN